MLFAKKIREKIINVGRQIFPTGKGQSGQGVMEYIILSSLIGIFCIIAIKQFGGVLLKRIEAMQAKIVKTIEI